MAVPKAFSDALDIKFLERVKDKKSTWLWTQGCSFDFHPGDVFYNSPKAYSPGGMHDANLCVQILDAKPLLRTETTVETKNGKQKKTYDLDRGFVQFVVLRANLDHSAWVTDCVLTGSQVDFVQFLYSGDLSLFSKLN